MSLDIDRLYKSIKRVDKFLKQSPKHPTPETIHHVRTGTRRLESAFDALKLGKRTERLRRQLSGLRKRCGKVRDMDVLTGLTLSVDPDPQDKACLVQLTEYLGAKRVRQNEKLRTFAKKRGPRIRRDLDRVSKKLDRLAKSEKRGLTPPETERSSTLADIASKLRFPAKLTKGKLHPYRLQVKELQYVLQLSKMQHQPRIVSTLGNVKDAIGEWHDWEELVAIASELLDDGPQSGLVQQLASISNKKFEHALAVTKKMRAAYIDGKNRKPSRRRASGRTIRFPVSVAHFSNASLIPARVANASNRKHAVLFATRLGTERSVSLSGAASVVPCISPRKSKRITGLLNPSRSSTHESTTLMSLGGPSMASQKQRSAARRNIKKATAAARRKRTIAHLPKATRRALGKQASKVARRSR